MQYPALIEAPLDAADPNSMTLPPVPYQMAVLANGLTLIVHENRRNPLVCSQIRFNVGSKDEPQGRTGFAHLFEHLMFKESEHRRGNWHKTILAMGGVGVNGTTNLDRTNYYQTVPSAALDQLLWMESDRMGHLLGGLDAATLADEVSVVKNEKRQREGAPYGGVFEAVTTALYPREHPYGHTVLGSFEDLDNASIETVADWHARWYGASNAILVLSGDISFEEALSKVEYWFGGLPAGSPVRRATQWLPEIRETKRVTLFDRVPYRRLYSIWSTPNAADQDSALLHVVAQILGGGSFSRLAQRLVDHDKLCLGINVNQDGRYLCGEFHVISTLAPTATPSAVEAAIDEEIARFIAEGPTQQELDRVRKSGRTTFLRALDDIGQVADLLANNMTFYGRPDGHLTHADLIDGATPDMVREVAARWLSRKALEVDVQKFDAVSSRIDAAERSRAPGMGEPHAPAFPRVEHGRLSNGLAIQFVRQSGTHGAGLALCLDNGSTLDPESADGVSQITLNSLSAGTRSRTKLDLAETMAEKGLNFSASLQKDFTVLTMGALRYDLGEAMDLMAEMLLEPSFPEDELRLLLDRQAAEAQAGGLAPGAATTLAAAPLIYGRTHAYARSPIGTAQSLRAISREMIVARHQAWLDPAQATLAIVGDCSFDAVMAMVEKAFGGWAPALVTQQAPTSVWLPSPGAYFIERNGGPQSALLLAMASPKITLGNEALAIFNSLFGGSFNSRLNSNLRERRGWTYGASSNVYVSPQIGSFQIRTEVQGDKTLDALEQIELELKALGGERRVTSHEIEEARSRLLVGLASRWAGTAAIMNALIERIVNGLPDDFHDHVEDRIRGVTTKDIDAVAVLVGDRTRYSVIVAGDAANVRTAAFTTIDEYANPL
ncbi:M16 family metallopeptidase [Sphingomonas sp. OTU376]|uniref:M16 family metallopeptidase n=1 Tax=Sphingomonas sp. OTU376 TaxID=3043863 RepID=UPI00313ACB2C